MARITTTRGGSGTTVLLPDVQGIIKSLLFMKVLSTECVLLKLISL